MINSIYCFFKELIDYIFPSIQTKNIENIENIENRSNKITPILKRKRRNPFQKM